ncbi:alpha/beta-hydrolase [Sparassis latifolia]|uniref:Protein AIM2 n=1 Tax=Sparassis crispa TaxID=139825 RepID=A0A401GWN9_9APHY|nr:Protein AIM2 [Sparassis crispa]GBE86631.1 Protein AIM2 [Sparassis crispa]
MSLCEYCVTGVIHEGVAEGKFEKVGGIECYVATPTKDYAKDTVILHLTDLFGIQLINHQLLADSYARNGLKVVVPDILFGDAVPLSALSGDSDFDFDAWLGNHGPNVMKPIVEKVITALKAEGVTKFGVIGYCYGARGAVDLAFLGVPSAVVLNHPFLLQIPADLEKYKEVSKASLLINSCETDPMFPQDAQAKADELFASGFAPGYKRLFWEGCAHGFSVRGDLSDPKVKAGKEGAFKEAVKFFKKHL